jgi:hypothetical protein
MVMHTSSPEERQMAMNVHRETARIYEFPLRPRLRLEDGRTIPTSGPEFAPSVVDQCWYHNEALHDETTTPDRPKAC